MDAAFLVGFPLALCGAAYAIGQAYLSRRLRHLKEERQGENFHTFAQSFRGSEYSQEKLRLVYRFFQRWVGDDTFPVRPSDSIQDVYGIVDDDVDRMILKLAGSDGEELPALTEGGSVETVADVVRLVAKLDP